MGCVRAAYRVEDVRAAEQTLLQTLPPDALMQRAAFGLAGVCIRILKKRRSRLVGAKVVILVGTGFNGGDALFAGKSLASRGAQVLAIMTGDECHEAGAQALRRAGGHIEKADIARHAGKLSEADLIIDGILGIGGNGALHSPAAELAVVARDSAAPVVAVDLPSGVDADTGAVADPDRVVTADVTVTFGCLKSGLVIAPAMFHVGKLVPIDIGLTPALADKTPALTVMKKKAVAALLPIAQQDDDKYTRGVVGVVAGSAAYPGAGILATGSARYGGAGMVRYAGEIPEQAVSWWPEVVVATEGPAEAGRVQAWVIGPGAGKDTHAKAVLHDVLDAQVPVLIDADALTLVSEDDYLAERIRRRNDEGLVTVLTPHAGEFARLGYPLPAGEQADRLGAVRDAAARFGAVILLKGASTIVASPEGNTFVNTTTTSALSTAGSGDVLSGLAGSMLARNSGTGQLDNARAAEVVAAAAFVHGMAGQIATGSREGSGERRRERRRLSGRPVTASDVMAQVPSAIATIRSPAE